MKKATLSILISIIFHAALIAQTDSLYYHDSVMESQWGSSTSADAFGCFVRFTPPAYPAKLTGIRAWFRSAGANSIVRWKVYLDPAGNAMGGVSVANIGTVTANPAAGGVTNQDYISYFDLSQSNIMVYAGDVYAGVVQNTDFFGIGIDNAPNNAVAPDRQWQWMTVFGNNYWNTLSSQASSGQFGITAIFDPFNTGIDEANSDAKIYFDNISSQLEINSLSGAVGQLKIYDLTGRMLFRKNIFENTASINLDFLKSGIYFVGVFNEGELQNFRFAK